MDYNRYAIGSSGDTMKAIARGSSEAAWALSGGNGPSEGFDPFILSTYGIFTLVLAPVNFVYNLVADALGSI